MENPTPAPAPMNRKMRYYYNHKDDPEFRQRMAESKRRYYQANRDAIIQKSLTRYYQIKALINPPVEVADPAV